MTQDYLNIATENMTSFKEQIVILAKSYTMYKIGKLHTYKLCTENKWITIGSYLKSEDLLLLVCALRIYAVNGEVSA